MAEEHISCFQHFVRIFLYNKGNVTKARVLSEPKYQNDVKIWYIIYRLLDFIAWVFIFLYNRPMDVKNNYREKWLIFATYLYVTLGMIQSLLGLLIVVNRCEHKRNFDADQMQLSVTEKVYWFLSIVTSVITLEVILVYWILLHDPQVYALDIQNVLTYICSAILILVDNLISKFLFKTWNMWWSQLILGLCLISSDIYYFNGGYDVVINEEDNYKILDMRKPNVQILTFIFGIGVAAVLHYILFALELLGDFVYNKITEVPRDVEMQMDAI